MNFLKRTQRYYNNEYSKNYYLCVVKERIMTPNDYLKTIFQNLLKEKGKDYVEKCVAQYKNKDSQDRYRLKKALMKMLKE